MQDSTTVVLRLKVYPPGTPSYALYLYDKGITKKIMSQAINKSAPDNPNRFNELLAKYPPVPPDGTK